MSHVQNMRFIQKFLYLYTSRLPKEQEKSVFTSIWSNYGPKKIWTYYDQASEKKAKRERAESQRYDSVCI